MYLAVLNLQEGGQSPGKVMELEALEQERDTVYSLVNSLRLEHVFSFENAISTTF